MFVPVFDLATNRFSKWSRNNPIFSLMFCHCPKQQIDALPCASCDERNQMKLWWDKRSMAPRTTLGTAQQQRSTSRLRITCIWRIHKYEGAIQSGCTRKSGSCKIVGHFGANNLHAAIEVCALQSSKFRAGMPHELTPKSKYPHRPRSSAPWGHYRGSGE